MRLIEVAVANKNLPVCYVSPESFAFEIDLIDTSICCVESFLERCCVRTDGENSSTGSDDVLAGCAGSGMEYDSV